MDRILDVVESVKDKANELHEDLSVKANNVAITILDGTSSAKSSLAASVASSRDTIISGVTCGKDAMLSRAEKEPTYEVVSWTHSSDAEKDSQRAAAVGVQRGEAVQNGEAHAENDPVQNGEAHAENDPVQNGGVHAESDPVQNGEAHAESDTVQRGEAHAESDTVQRGEAHTENDPVQRGEAHAENDTVQRGEAHAESDPVQRGETYGENVLRVSLEDLESALSIFAACAFGAVNTPIKGPEVSPEVNMPTNAATFDEVHSDNTYSFADSPRLSYRTTAVLAGVVGLLPAVYALARRSLPAQLIACGLGCACLAYADWTDLMEQSSVWAKMCANRLAEFKFSTLSCGGNDVTHGEVKGSIVHVPYDEM